VTERVGVRDFMNFDSCLLIGFWLFILFVGCAFFFQRFRWRRRKRLGRAHLGFYPSSTSMGNALQELQIFAQPRVEYILQEKFDEDVDQDDAGGPEDPTRHFRRQVRKIRNGEKIDQLTVPLRKDTSKGQKPGELA
jgi:hypothetical protein